MQGTAQRRIVMLHGHFDVTKAEAGSRGGSSSSAGFDVEALQHILEHDNHHTRSPLCLIQLPALTPGAVLLGWTSMLRCAAVVPLQALDEGADALRPLCPVSPCPSTALQTSRPGLKRREWFWYVLAC